MSPEAKTSPVRSETPDSAWRTIIYDLAEFERPSASEGERHAAELIAVRLRGLGCQVQIEEERAHGGYWWPITLANVLAAAGAGLALRRPGRSARLLAGAVSAGAAAALWDDLGHGHRWFRRILPRRRTWNVVAETGDVSAERTVALVAHHDAAHSGMVFHPSLGRIGPRLFPQWHERANQTVPILYGVWLGPIMAAAGALLGSRRLLGSGVTVSLGASAVMIDIAGRRSVPGANDNLSAVGILVAIAAALERAPIDGVRVLLISTGSEESFSEGMQAFGRRHFPELDPARTEFLCLECLGGPILCVLEGEGMLKMRHYPQAMRQALADAAEQAGVKIKRGLRTVAATDALIALRAGYPTVTLASVAETKLPLNYHWPSDRPEALHWDTIEQAIAVCDSFLRRRDNGASLSL